MEAYVETCRFITGDLVLVSEQDLQPFIDVWMQEQMKDRCSLRVNQQDDGLWYARCSVFTDEDNESANYEEPEQVIAHILAMVNDLPVSCQELWRSCLRKEIDLGYHSGVGSIVHNRLPAVQLLGLAEQGLDLVVTLYPGDAQT